jgi:chromosome segregation ATPase
MGFNVQKWLTDEMGFTAEEAAALTPQFMDRSDRLEKGILRQSDYSRQMNDLKKLETQLAENNEKLNADLAEFATMTAGEQGEATKLRDRIEAAETKALHLTQKITRYAETNGIDVKEVLGDVEPVKKVEPVAFDDKALRGDIRNQIGGVANYLLDLTAVVDDIADEHQRLTGQRFNRREFIAGIKADIAAGKTENIDPVKRWEAANNIPTLRTEAETKRQNDAIAAAKEEGRMAGLSERALPGEGRPGENSPVFKMGGESKLQRPQPGNRLAGAVSALATGRYRPKTGAA